MLPLLKMNNPSQKLQATFKMLIFCLQLIQSSAVCRDWREFTWVHCQFWPPNCIQFWCNLLLFLISALFVVQTSIYQKIPRTQKSLFRQCVPKPKVVQMSPLWCQRGPWYLSWKLKPRFFFWQGTVNRGLNKLFSGDQWILLSWGPGWKMRI